MTVAVLALVHASVVAQVSRGTIRCHGAFCDSRDGWGVVGASGECGVADVMVVSDDAYLAEDTGVFQVAVGDVAMKVCGGDQVGLNIGGKGVSPDVALACVVVVDTAHSRLSCVSGSQPRGFLGHDFG